MCGRYALYGPVSRLREAFDAQSEGFEFEPRPAKGPRPPAKKAAARKTA